MVHFPDYLSVVGAVALTTLLLVGLISIYKAKNLQNKSLAVATTVLLAAFTIGLLVWLPMFLKDYQKQSIVSDRCWRQYVSSAAGGHNHIAEGDEFSSACRQEVEASDASSAAISRDIRLGGYLAATLLAGIFTATTYISKARKLKANPTGQAD